MIIALGSCAGTCDTWGSFNHFCLYLLSFKRETKKKCFPNGSLLGGLFFLIISTTTFGGHGGLDV